MQSTFLNRITLRLGCGVWRCALTWGRQGKRTFGKLEGDLITDVVDGDVREEAFVGESAEEDHLGLANAHRRVPAARDRKTVRLLLGGQGWI